MSTPSLPDAASGVPDPSEFGTPTIDGDQALKRGLQNRHLQLIAIGGAIGTGLFMGSGRNISLAGPSIILVYAIIGFFLYFVMRAMGEILLSNYAYKSFPDFAADCMGPWASFYAGWTYWICWAVSGSSDIAALCSYFNNWFPDVHPGFFAAFVIVCVFILNLFAVKVFGEVEFWFSMIKVATIIALIIFGIILIVINFQPQVAGAPPASITHLWDRGGFFPMGWMGFITGFQIAIYSFIGIEIAGTAAAETSDPTKNLPKAINAIPVRVVIFYVGALTVIMSVQPWDMINPDVSPFVELFGFIGISIAFHVINFVVLTAGLSSANSGMYSTSRIMYGLANDKTAPPWMGKLNSRHVPRNALFIYALLLTPSIALVSFTGSLMDAFVMVAGASAILYLTVWVLIVVCYLFYRHKYPERHKESVFPMPFGKLTAWATLVFFAVIFVILAVDPEMGWTVWVVPIWITIVVILYWALRKTRAQMVPVDWNALREPAFRHAEEELKREQAEKAARKAQRDAKKNS